MKPRTPNEGEKQIQPAAEGTTSDTGTSSASMTGWPQCGGGSSRAGEVGLWADRTQCRVGVAKRAEEVGTSFGSAGWYRSEAEVQVGYDERLVPGRSSHLKSWS